MALFNFSGNVFEDVSPYCTDGAAEVQKPEIQKPEKAEKPQKVEKAEKPQRPERSR